ncbi:3-(3-hydroxy-phenyl)propionate/3-hydroxycinnamic acid hydroxylase [compost metagenome]
MRHAVYQFRSRIAETWRHGRVLLAGDAAHLMPPFMGQGMCSGIRDAWNLSWRLDLIFKGLCADTLLDSYTLERKPQIRAVIDASVEMGKVVCVADPQKAAERDAAFLAGEVPPLPPFPGLVDGAVFKDPLTGNALGPAGALGVHGQIEYDGHSQRYDDVFGRGFHLLSIDDDPLAGLSPAHKALLEHLQVTSVHLSLDGTPGTCRDLSGKYHRFLAEAGLQAVLVRPDFYLYGGVSNLAELPQLLDALGRDLGIQQAPGGAPEQHRLLAAQL